MEQIQQLVGDSEFFHRQSRSQCSFRSSGKRKPLCCDAAASITPSPQHPTDFISSRYFGHSLDPSGPSHRSCYLTIRYDEGNQLSGRRFTLNYVARSGTSTDGTVHLEHAVAVCHSLYYTVSFKNKLTPFGSIRSIGTSIFCKTINK